MTEILLISDGFFHPPFMARRYLQQTLSAVPNLTFQRTRSLNSLPTLDLTSYKALVLYFHHQAIILEALEKLDQFVQAGGGILAIHSATASFKGQPGYFEILGGRFTGHGPVQNMTVTPVQKEDPIFGSIPSFAIKDELYLHEQWPDIQVHFTTPHEGQPQPLVWTRTYGDGRVCYICPGHRSRTMKQPEIQEMMKKGLNWVSRNKISD